MFDALLAAKRPYPEVELLYFLLRRQLLEQIAPFRGHTRLLPAINNVNE
jgi:hypothetical protein